MKYFLSTALLVSAFWIGANAQEKSLTELKNEAVKAIQAKDFKTGLALYEQAMPLMTDAPDGVVYYNAAYCAKTINDDEKALKYYTESEKIRYKGSNSLLNVALLLEKLGRDEEMEQALISGVSKYPGTKDLEQMKSKLVTYYLIEGSKPYNAAGAILAQAKPTDQAELDKVVASANEKFAEAKPWFEKAALYAEPGDERITKPLAEINSRLNP
jgi:hypothetical protein